MFNIHLLPAAFGDSILIEYGEADLKYILIDGGPYYNDGELAEGMKRVAPNLRELELLVITHIDIDHIDGVVSMLNTDPLPFKIKDVWFNGFDQLEEVSRDLGALQGEYITALIRKKNLSLNKSFHGKPVVVEHYENLPVKPLPGGMELTLLSPGVPALQKLEKVWKDELKKYSTGPDFEKMLAEDKRYDSDAWLGTDTIEELQNAAVKPDKSEANGSSIAFIATYKGKSCLLAGDATSDYLLMAIEPMLKASGKPRLHLDAWKLAHHGSKKSNLEKLMEKIDCKNMLVSSNGARYEHPDEACIAKLLKHNGPGLTFYFNYKTTCNERKVEITLDTITNNGKKLGKYSMAGFIGNGFVQFNLNNSSEYLKDTLFTWQEKELPTLVFKQEYVYAIKWLQSDSSTLHTVHCTTYHAKGIGNVRTTVFDSVHNKLVNIDLIEIRDIKR